MEITIEKVFDENTGESYWSIKRQCKELVRYVIVDGGTHYSILHYLFYLRKAGYRVTYR